jgi:hypothetical protein
VDSDWLWYVFYGGEVTTQDCISVIYVEILVL